MATASQEVPPLVCGLYDLHLDWSEMKRKKENRENIHEYVFGYISHPGLEDFISQFQIYNYKLNITLSTMDHFEYFSIHPITSKHGLIQFHSKDEKQIKVTLLGLDPRMTDTTIKASFSRFGELKTLLRHTFKFKGKEYLNGNISLYFTKLTH